MKKIAIVSGRSLVVLDATDELMDLITNFQREVLESQDDSKVKEKWQDHQFPFTTQLEKLINEAESWEMGDVVEVDFAVFVTLEF